MRSYDSFASIYNRHWVRTGYDETECLATFQDVLFTSEEDEHWRRSDFEITERVYNADTVIDLLGAAGFVDVEIHIISKDGEDRPFRWLFHCRRG